MKNKIKKLIYFFILANLFFSPTILSNLNNINYYNIEDIVLDDNDKSKIKEPTESNHWANFSFIHIDGNWSQAVAWGWCKGDGSWTNPYTLENITINAANSPIQSGILIQNSINEYFRINNCTIFNVGGSGPDYYQAGIKIDNSANGTLTVNNCTNNRFGILMRYSNNISILDNKVNDSTGGAGIYLNNCLNSTIKGNKVYNNSYGIKVYNNSDNNIISENDFSYNRIYGLWITIGCDKNTISINNFTRNDLHGIDLSRNCNHNNISENEIIHNGWAGIYVNGIYNIILKNNFSANNQNPIFDLYSYGILIVDEGYNIISNNNITSHYYGIYLSQSNYNNVTYNTILKHTYCIGDYKCIGNIYDNYGNCKVCYIEDFDGDGDSVDEGDNIYTFLILLVFFITVGIIGIGITILITSKKRLNIQ